jgi:hypothetical protein
MEGQVDKTQIAWNEKIAKSIIGHLVKRRMEGSYAATAEQARDEVLAMIPPGAVVTRGGSMSTAAIGLWEKVAELPGVKIWNHSQPGLSPAEVAEARRQGLLADILIASSNAITLDGRLVNLDGSGNRVAGMISGPKKVILVVGMNKVKPTLEAAMAHVKHYSAPLNAQRIGVKTPCRETGVCSDCNSPQRLCNTWSIIEGQMAVNEGRIHVKLVGADLGY